MSCHAPASKKPHQNPTPLTPAERAVYDAMCGVGRPTSVTLTEETFALAACHLEDWPLAHARLRRARRYLLAQLHGADGGAAPTEDLWFAAQWIVRALDADLGLSTVELIALFDAIGLPIDALPVRAQREAPRSRAARAAVARLRRLGLELGAATDSDLDVEL
ncbi:MAG: hypothetical protein H6708_27750 [Kofleriaceae bacterium]|nr:hypothetical protein [Myxococcales bacterium]MCB9564203.1 hypothetical protein [Kofleriaceae bacterium]